MTPRLERAITKLYNAFHKGELEAGDCSKCAVGNLCDNESDWRYINEYEMFSEYHNGYSAIEKTGYSVKEIMDIEHLFMYGVKRDAPGWDWNAFKGKDKELQFKGLCAVVEYLCELDNVPNVMDIKSLFEYDNNNQPISELCY
jgi:hypothetical protein